MATQPKDVQPQRVKIENIAFKQLIIPPYQRPYKWTAKNVNQLINDIIEFKEQGAYRLGTLVLYENENKLEIVDGQQRIITLVLLLKLAIEHLTIEDKKQSEHYQKVLDNIDCFSNQEVFSNIYSLHNIVENICLIRERLSELTQQFVDFVLTKCEFVEVRLNDISECFQFFDSQNARGKDLEAHDLLKAYHLREITEMKQTDLSNIELWQQTEIDFLRNLFLTLFRAKKWSKGKSARYFTKDEIETFKGVSLSSKQRYPFYQTEVIAHVF